MQRRELLSRAMKLADDFLASADARPVHQNPDHDGLLERLGGTSGTMPTDGIRAHDAMRVSISAWNTTHADIDRSAVVILDALDAEVR